MFEEYIPQYFEDDAPLSIMMSGVFMYSPGDPEWSIYYRNACTAADESRMPSCGVLISNFYIGAEGMVCPCMGMADCGYAENFPNLFETPLRDILGGEYFKGLCHAKVGEVRDANPQCRECEYVDRCTGGCRNAALMAGDDYLGIDPYLCWFFGNGGEARIEDAAREAFAAYLERNPPKGQEDGLAMDVETIDCP